MREGAFESLPGWEDGRCLGGTDPWDVYALELRHMIASGEIEVDDRILLMSIDDVVQVLRVDLLPIIGPEIEPILDLLAYDNPTTPGDPRGDPLYAVKMGYRFCPRCGSICGSPFSPASSSTPT